MVPREHFVNKIRSLGYKYKTQHKRTYLYRKTNGTHFIPVPKSDLLEDEYVISALRQAGLADEDIKAFLASAKS
jgi:hypothetical protein